MKKTYIIPTLQVAYIAEELPIAQSRNRISADGNSATLDPNNMVGGDGGDAVKTNTYNVWDDEWK